MPGVVPQALKPESAAAGRSLAVWSWFRRGELLEMLELEPTEFHLMRWTTESSSSMRAAQPAVGLHHQSTLMRPCFWNRTIYRMYYSSKLIKLLLNCTDSIILSSVWDGLGPGNLVDCGSRTTPSHNLPPHRTTRPFSSIGPHHEFSLSASCAAARQTPLLLSVSVPGLCSTEQNPGIGLLQVSSSHFKPDTVSADGQVGGHMIAPSTAAVGWPDGSRPGAGFRAGEQQTLPGPNPNPQKCRGIDYEKNQRQQEEKFAVRTYCVENSSSPASQRADTTLTGRRHAGRGGAWRLGLMGAG